MYILGAYSNNNNKKDIKEDVIQSNYQTIYKIKTSNLMSFELNKLKDNTRYVMYFEFNYRLNHIIKCCFYKSVKETWQHKCKVNANKISYVLFDTSIFNEKCIFKSEYIYE